MGSSSSKDEKAHSNNINVIIYENDKKRIVRRLLPTDALILSFVFDQELLTKVELANYYTGFYFPYFGSSCYHEFLVLETSKYYWSIEKIGDGIFLQQSERRDLVTKFFNGEHRRVNYSIKLFKIVNYSDSIPRVMQYVIDKGEQEIAYNRNNNNLVSKLYDAIVRENGESLVPQRN